MAKIKDRIFLGFVSGLGANVLKLSIEQILKRINLSEIDGPERAAGMLIPPHTIAKKSGKAVGYLADSAVAGLIGIAAVYLLSFGGKDKAVLKGAITGHAVWTCLYGVLGTMGATKVNAAYPTTILCEFGAHTAFGACVAALATKLGDSSLFDGSKPISISPTKVQLINQPDV